MGKLNSERLVPLGDDAAATAAAKLQQLGNPRRIWLLPSRSGRKISYPTIRRAWVDAIQNLGLRDSTALTVHRLRHTFATEMLNAGMSLHALKEILGHRDINMTLRYATPGQQYLTEEYESAIATLEKRYALESSQSILDSPSSAASIDVVVRTIQRNASEQSADVQHKARHLVKRLKRIGDQLDGLGL